MELEPQETPENALVLPKWTGDNSDRSLISLAQFLEEVSGETNSIQLKKKSSWNKSVLQVKNSDVEDVREVLSYYRQFEDPIEAFRWVGDLQRTTWPPDLCSPGPLTPGPCPPVNLTPGPL